MKNMMLQVRNSNKSNSPKGVLTVITVSLLTVLSTVLIGCKDKNAPETFNGDVARPTWTAPTKYDYSSSMTAVIKVDLKAQYPDKAADFVLDNNDLLAAFSGDECLGTASPQDGLFFLYIAGPSSLQGGDGGRLITLRYYSAHYKNLFEAVNAFPFVNDTQQGTIAEPFKPAFVVAK